MATAGSSYFCHRCQVHLGHLQDLRCPRCQDDFLEEVAGQRSSPATPSSRIRMTFGGGTELQHEYPVPVNADLGTLLQTVINQISAPQYPFAMGTGGGQMNLNALLSQFLTLAGGQNNGPAPASESRITSLPTVELSATQLREQLQCAICMDDFQEKDQLKRLPCSHHFHPECISRWLRLHGTCPTCRVVLTNSFNSLDFD